MIVLGHTCTTMVMEAATFCNRYMAYGLGTRLSSECHPECVVRALMDGSWDRWRKIALQIYPPSSALSFVMPRSCTSFSLCRALLF